jgi:hypothetical protein
MVTVEGRELIGLYLFLKDREPELDMRLRSLVDRLEQVLFTRLSIDDFENLEEKYKNNQISL